MKVPTALFSGGQDTLADPKDVAVLLTQVSGGPRWHLNQPEHSIQLYSFIWCHYNG